MGRSAYMTTPLGLQPIDSTGLRTLTDALSETFSKLDEETVNEIKAAYADKTPRETMMTTPMGVIPVNSDGARFLTDVLSNALSKLDTQTAAEIKIQYSAGLNKEKSLKNLRGEANA